MGQPPAFLVLHELAPYRSYSPGIPVDEREWVEVLVMVGSIFSIKAHPHWVEGSIVSSTGSAYLEVREGPSEIVDIMRGAL
jgi:hypothetical protein